MFVKIVFEIETISKYVLAVLTMSSRRHYVLCSWVNSKLSPCKVRRLFYKYQSVLEVQHYTLSVSGTLLTVILCTIKMITENTSFHSTMIILIDHTY